MKAVIYTLSPSSRVIDLTHGVEPQDIAGGAMMLEDSWFWLPADSVVCAVVDPGVGGNRQPIAASIEGRWLVGPDNGLFATILERNVPREIVRIRPGSHVRPDRSATFHGRDLFAPAAALIARGESMLALGDQAAEFQRLPIAPANSPSANHVELRVIAIDHFGNLALNLKKEQAAVEWPWLLQEQILVRCGDKTFAGIEKTFSDVAPGDPVIYWNSFARLEIAINQGNAARQLGLARGAAITLTRGKSEHG